MDWLVNVGVIFNLISIPAFLVGVIMLIPRRLRRRGMWTVLTSVAAFFAGGAMITVGDAPGREAKAIGFTGAADRAEALKEGITNPDRWRETKISRASEAERAALLAEAAKAKEADRERDEIVRKSVEEARVRLAAEAAAEKARAEEDARCKTDLQCIGDKKSIEATFACRKFVENLAKTDFKWIDGWTEPKFSRFRFKDTKEGTITYIGDKIQYQNGFGNWIRHIYECDYNVENKSILDVRARPGRLPG